MEQHVYRLVLVFSPYHPPPPVPHPPGGEEEVTGNLKEKQQSIITAESVEEVDNKEATAHCLLTLEFVARKYDLIKPKGVEFQQHCKLFFLQIFTLLDQVSLDTHRVVLDHWMLNFFLVKVMTQLSL